MKLVDRYIKLKMIYPDYVILIRCGSFYNTFFDDAIVLSCLCGYKLVGSKIGFPVKVLNKVKSTLFSNGFKCLVVERNMINKIYSRVME